MMERKEGEPELLKDQKAKWNEFQNEKTIQVHQKKSF